MGEISWFFCHTYIRPECWIDRGLLPVDKVDVGKVHVPGEDGLHPVGGGLPHGASIAVLLGLKVGEFLPKGLSLLVIFSENVQTS